MIPVILPKMRLTMEEAEIVRWFKKEGEPVRVGEAFSKSRQKRPVD
jgi:pyruvate/2-oxoglutarate dehydrogenase complex dihydrolipoamide acyltransferase (E2) component